MQLLSITIITRHGVRTAMKQIPNDTAYWKCEPTTFNYQSSTINSTQRLNLKFDVKNKLKGNCHTGQLLQVGYDQHVDLSVLYKRLYSQFTPKFVRTSYIPRVQLSLLGQLNNYPNQLAHIGTKHIDYLFKPDNCSYYSKYSRNINNLLGKGDDLKRIQQIFGYAGSWDDFSDQLHCRIHGKAEVPHNLTQKDINTVIEQGELKWKYMNVLYEKTKRMQYLRASVGPFMKDLESYIKLDQMNIISAHDSTIGPMASILIDDNQWNGGQPGFASFIAIERYQDNQIKIRFRDGYNGDGDYVIQKACGQITCSHESVIKQLSLHYVSVSERDNICRNEVI